MAPRTVEELRSYGVVDPSLEAVSTAAFIGIPGFRFRDGLLTSYRRTKEIRSVALSRPIHITADKTMMRNGSTGQPSCERSTISDTCRVRSPRLTNKTERYGSGMARRSPSGSIGPRTHPLREARLSSCTTKAAGPRATSRMRRSTADCLVESWARSASTWNTG